MTGFEWLVVALGLAVAGWMVLRMNQVSPDSTTNYKAPAPINEAAKVEKTSVSKDNTTTKPARKTPAKKVAAKKSAER